jgi:hypothetical protein
MPWIETFVMRSRNLDAVVNIHGKSLISTLLRV